MALDPDLLLRAYAIGAFPMSDSRDAAEVFWVQPRRRAILPLDGFHLSRSLRKTLRAGPFEVTRDRAFGEVVRACAAREDTWINGEIEASYVGLFEAGHAHSVEVWKAGALVGITHAIFHRSCWLAEPTCYLQDLYVDASQRGKGCGEALIEAVADLARQKGAGRLYWLTQEDNTAARRLYERVARASGFIQYRKPL